MNLVMKSLVGEVFDNRIVGMGKGNGSQARVVYSRVFYRQRV